MSRCQRTAKISSFSLEEEKIDCYQRGNISRFKFERAGERERMRERVRESVRERERVKRLTSLAESLEDEIDAFYSLRFRSERRKI